MSAGNHPAQTARRWAVSLEPENIHEQEQAAY